jgi:hypothetical protein
MTFMTSTQTSAALAEATRWRLLGLLFERPRPGWAAEVEALASEVDDVDLSQAASAAKAAREADYIAFLGPGGLASPREVAYRGMHDPGRILSDIVAYHRAFHFTPKSEEPVDHIAMEASLIGYLYLKEAYALAAGDCDVARIAAAAAQSFLDSHLRYLGAPFAERIGAVGPEHLVVASRALATRSGAPPEIPALARESDQLECDGCAGLDDALPPMDT